MLEPRCANSGVLHRLSQSTIQFRRSMSDDRTEDGAAAQMILPVLTTGKCSKNHVL